MKSGMNDCSAWAELVKSSVSALDAGRALGLETNHDGRCRCPFHNGGDYNMKLYTGDKGYHCFVCHEHGDVIGLVQGVNNCTFVEAVQWLSDAFHLGIDTNTAMAEETRERAKKEAKTRRELHARQVQTDARIWKTYLDCADLVKWLERIIEDLAPKKPEDEWDPLWCRAVRLLPDAKRLLEEADDLVKLGIRGSDVNK